MSRLLRARAGIASFLSRRNYCVVLCEAIVNASVTVTAARRWRRSVGTVSQQVQRGTLYTHNAERGCTCGSERPQGRRAALRWRACLRRLRARLLPQERWRIGRWVALLAAEAAMHREAPRAHEVHEVTVDVAAVQKGLRRRTAVPAPADGLL